MELLTSKKFKLPTLYFISDRNEIKELPIGVPYIFGNESYKPYLIRILEYEVLYQKALATGLPFNFKKILLDNGFDDCRDFWYHETVYMDYITEEFTDDLDIDEHFDSLEKLDKDNPLFKEFIKDSTAYVDIQKLKELNVFPIWLDKIEKAVYTNIHNFALYNANMYNKKLEGMYGALELVAPDRNAIIIDISGSIPKVVSTTMLIIGKNMAETYYCDLIITGSKTTIYPYEILHELNVETIYEENGMDNDQTYFKNLVSEVKHYRTIIAFGDNHSPCDRWDNEYNTNTRRISRVDGKKLCKWTVDKIISFHTTSNEKTAGYLDWFTCDNIEKISDWVVYLNK